LFLAKAIPKMRIILRRSLCQYISNLRSDKLAEIKRIYYFETVTYLYAKFAPA